MTDVRNRLVKALHTSATLPQLREEIVLVLCDLEEECTPTLRSAAPCVTDANGRSPAGGIWDSTSKGRDDVLAYLRTQADDAPETERDSAPATPVDSQLGQEYGV